MFAGACSCQVEDSHIECQLVVEAYFTLRKTQEPVPVSLNSDRQFSIALHHWAAGAGCDGVRVLWAGCPGCAAAGGRCGRAVRTGGPDGRCRRAGGVAGGAAIGAAGGDAAVLRAGGRCCGRADGAAGGRAGC